jgi:hypothetical protein
MALKGDTRALGLADIFQALALSRREGILSVSCGGKEIKLHFSTGGLRLLSTGALRHTRLGSILLEMDDFAPKNLEFALQLQKQTGKKLGEVLVEYGFLTQEQIDLCLRRQIEEEITELFLWDNAEFHFEPGLPQEEYFDPTGEGRIFDLSVSRLLVEAARNVDEWSMLLLRVQNSGRKYVYKNGYPVMPDTSPFGISLLTVSKLPFAMKEPVTIDTLARELELDRNATAKLVAFLMRRGRVLETEEEQQPQPQPESAEAHQRYDWRKPRVLNIDNLGYRARIDEIMLSARTAAEAAYGMADLAEMARAEGDAKSGLDILRAALELSPGDQELRQRVIKAYVGQWKFAEAARLVVEGARLQHTAAS